MNELFGASIDSARHLDSNDSLSSFRDEFHFPKTSEGKTVLYFTGNSLGLQPKNTQSYVMQELTDWAALGVEGHWNAKHPWLPYHEFCAEGLGKLVGGLTTEVVAMNTLTVNLHMMMVSFYRPTAQRFKILVEGGAFPSDQYAVASQARFHGYDPKLAICELFPRPGEETLRTEDIVRVIEKDGAQIALIMLGGVNYRTGQAFDMQSITKAGHKAGCVVGFDLAHAAGNIPLSLHDWNVDFGVWCNYKYINAGPGAIAGCFVHERHAHEALPRFEGWWGHKKATRFEMGPTFEPIGGAETWQVSNPPILQLAALRASLDVFGKTSMKALREKSLRLTAYFEFLLETLLPKESYQILTPHNAADRGCQLSLRFHGNPKQIQKDLEAKGIITDFREPDVIRVAPVPLYNSFEDVFNFVEFISRSGYV